MQLNRLEYSMRIFGLSILMLIFGAIICDTGFNGVLASALFLIGFPTGVVSGTMMFYYLDLLG